jgi:hypothetical protein
MANSVLLGSVYIWDHEPRDQAVAMLWRSKDNVDSAGGYSGSINDGCSLHGNMISLSLPKAASSTFSLTRQLS